ncbi:hypothetical protein ACI1T6_01180 [Lactococcus petauri]|uniref:hypothetical protein n=1 Tax=Lactococcus petauri TaxID=1940789 RepID=UPI003854985E
MSSLKFIIKKLFLSFSSFYPALILYLMTIDVPVVYFKNYWFHDFLKMFILLMVGLVIAVVELKYFSKKAEDTSNIISIKPMESSVIPTYIGLFVIMLGFGEIGFQKLLPLVLLLFFLWILFERNYYFNIFWSILGYRFYEATDINGNTITLISKKIDMKNSAKDKSFEKLARINNFTFLEVEK